MVIIAIYNIYRLYQKGQNRLNFMKFCNGQRKIASIIKFFVTSKKNSPSEINFSP